MKKSKYQTVDQKKLVKDLAIILRNKGWSIDEGETAFGKALEEGRQNYCDYHAEDPFCESFNGFDYFIKSLLNNEWGITSKKDKKASSYVLLWEIYTKYLKEMDRG